MRKQLLLLFALLAGATTTFAQTNMASGKSATVIFNPNNYTYTTSGDGSYNLSNLTDGNETGGLSTALILCANSDADRNGGVAAFYIDLTEEYASSRISSISIIWKGLHSNEYKVYGTATAPTTYSTFSDLTTAASTWTELVSETNTNIGGGDDTNYTKTYGVAENSGFRYIVFVASQTNIFYGVAIQEFKVLKHEGEAALSKIMASASATTLTVGEGTATISATGYDQYGAIFATTFTYTSSNPSVATVNSEGVVSPVAAGTTNITVSSGEISATPIAITVKTPDVLPETVPSAPDNTMASLFANDGTASTGTTAINAYGGTNKTEVKTVESSKFVYVTDANRTFFNNGDVTSNLNARFQRTGDKEYKTLSVNLWSENNIAGYVSVVSYNAAEGGTETDNKTQFSLTAGEWKTIQINMESWDYVGNIGVYVDKVGDSYPNYAIANVYFLNSSVEANPFNIVVSGNVAKVTGNVATSNVEEIQAADVMMIDMSEINSITNPITITPMNRNALIRVPGTVDGTLATADSKVANLTAKNQVVVSGWTYPVDQIDFEDNGTNKFWNGEGVDADKKFISTSTRGYKITRSLAAESYATTCLPVAVSAIDGLEVYEFTGYESNTITLTRKKTGDDFNDAITANTPCILYATKAVDLVAEGTGDLNLASVNGTVTNGGITFKGNGAAFTPAAGSNLAGLTSDGKLAMLTTEATIGSFRAYFDLGGVSPSRIKVAFAGDDTTGIVSMNNAQGAMNSEVYDLQGVRVAQPTKGLYIKDGKKVIIR